MSNTATLTIIRTINAPRPLVWSAFTEAKHLTQWWGPAGSALEIKKLEFHEGGVFHYRMVYPDGNEMYGIFHYKEIKAPEKMVSLTGFANEKGEIIAPPFPGNFPKEIHNDWTFAETNGKTTVTLHSTPVHASPEEIAFFMGIHENMQQGYGATLDKLESYLPTIK